MKRCPQCNRIETVDTLAFCRVDGTPLVSQSGSVGEDVGTVRFGSAPVVGETETRILPTGETPVRPTAPTTVLDGRRTPVGTRGLGEPKHRRGVAIAAAAVILVALAASAYLYLSRGEGAAAKNFIAVLPFQNASGDPNMEYLSDGISENIINSLSQLSNVRVVARTTMFSFKGKDADPRAVGRQLGVDAVLTGKVVQRGDALTIQADLLNVADGTQMWGEQYNRKLTDLMALQGEIARDVSDKLRLKLSGADEQKLAKTYTANPEAHQLYLKGLFYRNKFNLIYTENSVRYFQQATAADPSYALAFAGLADSYATLALFEGGAPAHEVMPKARDAALKAVALDDGLGEAHAALGFILLFYDYDFAGAEREFKRALELSPNSGVMHQRYSQLLNFVGRHEEALAEIRRALALDPLSLIVNRGYGDRLIDARRYDEAVVQLKKTLELDGNFVLAYSSLAQVYQAQGDYAASVEASAKVYELTGRQQYATLARESFAKGGWQGYVRAMMERRPELWSYTRALYHAMLGEKDKAFAELNKAYENREAFLIRLKVDPRLDPLRSDPRFAELMRQVGLPQ
jgi:TolB-like protein/Flp pilus assembly protein TadD